MSQPLNTWSRRVELNNCVVFVRPQSKHNAITLLSGDSNNKILTNVTHPVVAATLDSMSIILEEQWIIDTLPISQVGTLFSFLDYKSKSEKSCVELRDSQENNAKLLLKTERTVAMEINIMANSLVEFFILAKLKAGESKLEILNCFLRNVESYWVSSFLLSQIMGNQYNGRRNKISEFCKDYGVSESYFRYLCHKAFSMGPKKQLRLWRAANSVLQLMETNRAISTIAGDNGYASSSHFSTEIKLMFGFTPREFKKLEVFFHE
ncbi:helix-turn-helix domain-containing protein [Enterobacter cloacae]|uniref:helix-turn-helix domain-containing protein n=1 Tax=Enterobacter cloacae TaxID=550 RepID=UPI002FFCDAB5